MHTPHSPESPASTRNTPTTPAAPDAVVAPQGEWPQTLPGSLRAQLLDWGPRWHHNIHAGSDAMHQAWQPLLKEAAQAADTSCLNWQHNLPYGPDPRQVLDVVAPAGAQNLPVLVFVHGGAFVRGDKAQTPWIYANVPTEFAQNGFVGVNLEYRLAPMAPWPGGAQDVRDAVLWLAQHVQRWGGNPQHMILMGHSAACAHCATATWDDHVRPSGGIPLKGLALLSPRVVADVRPENPNAAGVRAYFGDDTSQFAQRSPINHVRADAPPTFVAVAEYENPLIDFYGFELAHQLAQLADPGRDQTTTGKRPGPMPRFVQLPEHNHVSLIAQFNTAYNSLGYELRRWMARL